MEWNLFGRRSLEERWRLEGLVVDWREGLQLHRMEVLLFGTRSSRVTVECSRHGHGDTVLASRRLAFIGWRVVAAGLSILHVVSGAAGKTCLVLRVLELLLVPELLVLVLLLWCGRRRR